MPPAHTKIAAHTIYTTTDHKACRRAALAWIDQKRCAERIVAVTDSAINDGHQNYHITTIYYRSDRAELTDDNA